MGACFWPALSGSRALTLFLAIFQCALFTLAMAGPRQLAQSPMAEGPARAWKSLVVLAFNPGLQGFAQI